MLVVSGWQSNSEFYLVYDRYTGQGAPIHNRQLEILQNALFKQSKHLILLRLHLK